MRKWLMRSVLPGVDDVMASFELRVSMLMRLDLPTFERPMKAYSGSPSFGHFSTCVLLTLNSAFLMSIELSVFLREWI